MRMFYFFSLVCLLLFLPSFLEGLNIVLIISDDLGWGDVNFTQPEEIEGFTINTPTIEYYARNGIILDNYYAQPVCSPTRSSIMTGLYPIHTGLQLGPIANAVPQSIPLHADIVLFPEFLQSLYNYSTYLVGKWHLGFAKRDMTPQERGFDEFYGYYTAAEDYWNHTSPCSGCGNYTALDLGYHNSTNDVFDFGQSGVYSTHLFTTKAQDIIEKHAKTRPNSNMFLCLAYQTPHVAFTCDPDCDNGINKLEAPESYIAQQSQIKNDDRRTFAGMIGALDEGIKNVTETLQANNMWDDTILIFTSDNGAPAQAFNQSAMSNYPLRGQKGQYFEGGIRVPAFIYSPLLNKGYNVPFTYSGLMHVADWYRTILSMASSYQEIDKSNERIMLNQADDGYDLWSAIIHNEASPRTEILINIDPVQEQSAIRSGNYKLLENVPPAGWYYHMKNDTINEDEDDDKDGKYDGDGSEIGPVYLFDISTDPLEKLNIASEYPDIVSELQAKIVAYRATMIPPQSGIISPLAEPLVVDAGVWYSWEGEGEEA